MQITEGKILIHGPWAENRVIDWVRSSPRRDHLIAVAEQDGMLPEYLTDLLYKNPVPLKSYAFSKSVDYLRRVLPEEAFATIDWSVVRAALLTKEKA